MEYHDVKTEGLKLEVGKTKLIDYKTNYLISQTFD